MADRTVVVLGGGVGGVVAAHELRKNLGREHRVILVDRQPKHFFAPSFLWLMMGWRSPGAISRDLSRLERKGIQFVQAQVSKIDTENKKLQMAGGELGYDYLVVAPGAELAPDALPGFAQAAHTFYDVDSAARTRDVLKGFDGGSVAVLISSLPFKCPAAPYEAALLLDYAFRKKGIRSRVELKVVTPEPLPMPVAGPAVGNAVKSLLEGRDIAYHPKVKAVAVEPEKKEIVFEGGQRERFDLLVGIPPHRSPAVVRDSGLADASGWVPVDSKTLKTRYPGVFALGDATAVKLPSGMMLPKAGVFAHAQAQVAARCIAHEVENSGKKAEFDGNGF